MLPTVASDLRFPCRSSWCVVRGLGLVVLWLALLAGFVAQTTMASTTPLGHDTKTAAESPAEPASAS